jgi:hypothetical protein
MRYELIAGEQEAGDFDVALHLDADLRIVADVGPALDWRNWHGGMALVQHPSYFRTLASYPHLARMPRRFASEVKKRVQEGGPLGSWEHRRESTAFVPWAKRRTYVCGGVWFGRGREFASMVETLAAHVRQDRERNLMARWHDESHLNWFASTRRVSLLDPSYCWEPASAALIGVPPRIIAVDKGSDWTRD